MPPTDRWKRDHNFIPRCLRVIIAEVLTDIEHEHMGAVLKDQLTDVVVHRGNYKVVA